MEPFTSKSILFVADIGAEAKSRSMISAGRSVIGTGTHADCKYHLDVKSPSGDGSLVPDGATEE